MNEAREREAGKRVGEIESKSGREGGSYREVKREALLLHDRRGAFCFLPILLFFFLIRLYTRRLVFVFVFVLYNYVVTLKWVMCFIQSQTFASV